MSTYRLFDGAANEIGSIPIQYVRTSGIEIYESPGTEAYRSGMYSVSAWDYVQYSPTYVYSSTASAWTNGSVSGDRNQFWLKGSYPVVSFVTIGTSGVLSAAIEKIGGSITSIDIGPKSKNIQSTISNGIAYITMNQKDKLFININNTPSSPLCLFADPLKPAIPTTGNVIYYKPGVHSIGTSFSSFSDNTTIYLDGGAYVKGTFNIHPKNNIRIMGPGILAGDDYYETAISEKRAITNGDYTSIYKYISIRGPMDYNEIQTNWPSGVGVSGITILKTMFYAATLLNSVDGVKLISPWEYNTDGLSIFPDNSTSTCSHKNSFLFHADDSFFLMRNNNQSFNRQRGTILYDSNYVINHNNGPVVLAYQAEYYGSFTPKDQTASCINTDVLFFKSRGYSNPNDEPNALIKMYLGNSNSAASGTPIEWGYFNCIVSGFRVDNTVEVPIIRLSNYQDPFQSSRPPAGVASGILITDVTASASTWAISGNMVSGHYSNPLSGVEINSVTFRNLTFNGVKVDNANYREYFKFSTASDQHNYPEKNIKFIQDSYSKLKVKVSGTWRDAVAWVKTTGGWRATDTFFKNSGIWK